MAVTKRGWRFIASGGLIVVLVAAIVGLMISRESVRPSATRSAATGDTVTVGSVRWHVNGTHKAKELGDPASPVSAPGWFVVVDLLLTNTAAKGTTVDPAAIAVIDKDNKIYAADKAATATQVRVYNGEPILSLFQAELAPKKPTRVAAVFPVRAGASRLKLKVFGAKTGAAQDLIIDIGF